MKEKKKPDKLDIIKILKFFPIKDTVKRMKRQATDQEKIFAKDKSENSLSKI